MRWNGHGHLKELKLRQKENERLRSCAKPAPDLGVIGLPNLWSVSSHLEAVAEGRSDDERLVADFIDLDRPYGRYGHLLVVDLNGEAAGG